MNFLTHMAALLAAAAVTSSSIVKSPSSSPGEGNFELLILHNNDMHARFEQTSQLSGTCTTADREAGKCYGGFPRVAHVVKEARKAAASGEGPPVLYLNAGDTYTGTAWFTLYKWRIAAEFINALQPDAMSLGNNELEKGSSKLSPFLENLETKILASNVIVKGQEEKLQKSIIFHIQQTKVGVVGYLTPNANILDSVGTIEYIDEVIAVQDEVTNLKAQNVNIIIALGHADIDKDIEIAKEVEGLDLVISGHKNIFYWTGANAEDQHAEKVIEVIQNSGKRVPIVKSYAYNNILGRFHAKFDVTGEISEYHVTPIHLDSAVAQDTGAVNSVNKLKAEFAVRSEEVVGQTAVVLDGDSCKSEECNLGVLIVDATNYNYALRFDGDRWTDAPVSMFPGGLIAGSVSPSNRPADVTLGDLLQAIPTESYLVTVTMNGTVLNQVLEHSVATYSTSNPTGQFLQYSGVRVVYDLSKESGSRVVSAIVRCWACYVPEYYTIDDWRDYTVIMPAAMANGDFGYSMLVGLPRTDLEYDEVTWTAEFIRLRSPVYPEVAGRIQFVNYIAEPDLEVTTSAPTTSEPEPTEPEPDSAIAISSTLTILLLTCIPYVVS